MCLYSLLWFWFIGYALLTVISNPQSSNLGHYTALALKAINLYMYQYVHIMLQWNRLYDLHMSHWMQCSCTVGLVSGQLCPIQESPERTGLPALQDICSGRGHHSDGHLRVLDVPQYSHDELLWCVLCTLRTMYVQVDVIIIVGDARL